MTARAALKRYRAMRVAGATPEPGVEAVGGREGRERRAGLSYVIQLHHARSRHYDFRLELDGVLKSWAVPKGPSLDPATKRLAVEVEDHPLDYGGFEGRIPEGHYGAGEVVIWDRGVWQPEGDAKAARAALKKGHLDFALQGERLGGAWALIRTRMQGKQPQWLLMKQDDAAAKQGDEADEVALSAKPTAAAKPRRPASKPTTGKRAAMPKTIGLPLAKLVDRAPEGADWLHEIKFDGYRVLIRKNGDRVRVNSRNGVDYTDKLAPLVAAAKALPMKTCVLDAELVALDAQGRSRFGLLQQHMSEGGAQDIVAMAFDAPYLDGRDVRGEPLTERKRRLAAIGLTTDGLLREVEFHAGEGAALFAASCDNGLEGLICKRADSPYRAGRGGDWLKLKCVDSGEFVVVGTTPGKGARAALGSLLLALPGRTAREPWRYVGRVGSGFDEALLAWFGKQLRSARKPVELDEPPTRAQLLGATPRWVEPTLVAEVEHRGWTEEGRLRQAAFKTLRPDRSLASLSKEGLPMKLEAVEDESVSPKATRRAAGGAKKVIARKATARKTGVADASASAARVHFTHPERELFTDPVVTKAEIGAYYRDIARFVLPELTGRPLSLLRCPDGVAGTCFFQKHLTPGFGSAVKERRARRGEKLPYIDDVDGLMGLVQMNVVELHPWGAKLDDLGHPDRVVFDLDPAEDVAWKAVVAAARELRERLAALALESFVRTSGGKGLHVVVPLTGDDDWDAVKAFAHALASTLAQTAPERYVDVATKAKRQGRIFIDYLRNTRGATSVASYSLRARAGAPIATPLDWDELGRIRSGAQFHFKNIRGRLDKRGDAWEGIATVRQRLPT